MHKIDRNNQKLLQITTKEYRSFLECRVYIPVFCHILVNIIHQICSKLSSPVTNFGMLCIDLIMVSHTCISTDLSKP